MPLSVPPGVVAVFAQHRSPGGKAGIQGAAARDHAAGLMGVQAGQHRRARGRAVVRGRVVPAEGDRPLAQALEVRRQADAAPRDRPEPLREAQLVDHDHEDVRPPYGRGRRCDAPCRLGERVGSARRRLRPVAGAAATGDRSARAREQAAGDRAALQEGAPVGLLIWFHACGARADRWPDGVAGAGARRSGRLCGSASCGRLGFCPCGRSRSGLRTNDIEYLRDACWICDGFPAAGKSRRLAADADQLPGCS